jgi:hypothetical protein
MPVSARGIALIAVVVVVAALLYVWLSAGSVVSVSAATTMSITRSPSAFSIGGETYSIALARIAPGNSVAQVYLNKDPTFMNPLLNVTLYTGQETKVNAGSSFANIALQITSIGNNAVTLTVTPISTSLQIAPDSADIAAVNTGLEGLQQKVTTTTTIVTGNSPATTTVPGITTTTVPGTSTTTVASSNTTKEMVLAELQKSAYYPLMLNYSKLYANTVNCNLAEYDITYLHVNGVVPSGLSTFENVSRFVPYALYSNITSAGSGVYSVTYRTRTTDPNFNGVAALIIDINPGQQMLVSSALGGVFQGMNYNSLKSAYMTAENIGNACGVYVT